MMPVTSLLLATALAYSFGTETRLMYDVNVQLEGFLPLLGGNEGKVEIGMGVDVRGVEKSGDSLKSTSEITAFDIAFNGTKLPLDVSNVVEYFPKTTITLSPLGRILSTDAPDKKLPIRLPGLDVKHFPDITYVPIELPQADPAEGTTWTFKRDFGGAPIEYTCTIQAVESDIYKIKVNLTQSYKNLESSTYEVVAKPEEAVSEVSTVMTGEGMVEFDNAGGRVVKATMLNQAVSDVKDIKSGETKQRKLATKYAVTLKTKATATRVSAKQPNLWDQTVAFTTQAVTSVRNAVAWLKTASLFGLDVLPPQFAHLRPLIRQWAPWLESRS